MNAVTQDKASSSNYKIYRNSHQFHNLIYIYRESFDYLESQGMPIRQWLQPLDNTRDYMNASLTPPVSAERIRKLTQETWTLKEKLVIAQDKAHESKTLLNETLRYLSNLECSISKSSGNSIKSDKTSEYSKIKGTKGPYTSLNIPLELKEFWYPVEFSTRLEKNKLLSIELFGEAWVLWRDKAGKPACIKDQCAHRACPLSLGNIKDGEVQCPYHGWQFDRQGSCTKIPSTTTFSNVHVRSLPISERDGLIWVWAGETSPKRIPVEVTHPPSGFDVHSELVLEVPVEHGLLLENLLDLAHAPFTHTSTFAKGWPIPDTVKFHANKMLGGRWDPYPIDMSFEPPCMVISTVGLTQPGKIEMGIQAAECNRHLNQLHICLPSSEGTCRLLYRMSLDFLGWSREIPGLHKLWESVANEVLNEDLRLVVGQQQRLKSGANVWSNPVAYDKLGVRYRRWRNSVYVKEEKINK
jgi:chlorophyllide a oxygenase